MEITLPRVARTGRAKIPARGHLLSATPFPVLRNISPKSHLVAISIAAAIFLAPHAQAQADRGSIAGTVMDKSNAALQGAKVTLSPGGQTAVTDQNGSFIIPGLPPGQYTVQISYLGFEPYSVQVNVTAGSISKSDATLLVGSSSTDVEVRPERVVGEAEALNRQRVATNIVQVLPSEVINSLPNVNIADAAGRLPGVSLERDEGEGKYIHIRGTEPRLNAVTIDGIQVPSPENYRYVKLDTIPADLVESIELNKTLTADMDADGIGGSLNLVTRQATDKPYFAIEGLDGHSPINGVRGENQEFATYGRRFLADKKLGILGTGSYDWNGRGINDIEPGEAVNDIVALQPDGTTVATGQTVNAPNAIDLRDYYYDRSRYGAGGTLDYRFDDGSTAYVKGFYSYLSDFGEDSINTLNVGNFLSPTTTDQSGSTSFQDLYRRPVQQIWSVSTGGQKTFGRSTLNLRAALSQAKITGGFDDATFNGISPGTDSSGNTQQNGVAFNTATTDPFLPQFRVTATPNSVSVYDPGAYTLNDISFQNNSTFERDVVGQADYSRAYTLGAAFGTWQAGFKVRDVVKSQIYNEPDAVANNANIGLGAFPSNRYDGNYYFGKYQVGPQAQFTKIFAYYNANPGQFTVNANTATDLRGDFNVGERVYAGYLENTITRNRFRFNTGIRIESTSDAVLGYQPDASGNTVPVRSSDSYIYVLPSAGVQYNLNDYTDFRVAYSIGLARPNYEDITPYLSYTPGNANTASSTDLSAGNPGLKPTWAENLDLLAEHYLKTVGVIQGGVFYKQIFNDIFTSVVNAQFTPPGQAQPQTLLETLPQNSPSAHLIGVEGSWEQHLTRLPGALSGTGFRFNYSYVTSVAAVPGRSDHPALQNDAPNNYNVDLTYDKYGLSARMGLTHNDANIAAYTYQDGTPIAGSPTTPTAGGLHGPESDSYFYPHTQVDAQVSYLVPQGRGVSVVAQFLNLNNEVFGFYNGSEQYPTQREYYTPTYTFGLRWTSNAEHGSVFKQ